MNRIIIKIKVFLKKIKKQYDNAKSNVITAEEAYRVSKYGSLITDEELSKKCISHINELIKYKSINKSFCLMVDMQNEYLEFEDNIITYYKEKSYKVVKIDSTTNKDVDGKYLFISWSQK